MQLTTTAQLLEIYKKHHWLCTDSRNVIPGSVFFALKGDNFNGNLFAKSALETGASYAVIDEEDKYAGERTLLVKDVLTALQELASLYRSELKIPIIGITGTNGKTTTKELVCTALSARFNTIATPGNFNNHIGVPLTLLSIKPDTEIAVVEMGANHQGEIAALCRIARPTHGLITNIGKAHLEGFGGFEGVKRAKKELYDYLNENGGRVFVNSGNELLMSFSENSYRILYGTTDKDDISGKPFLDKSGYLHIDLEKPVVKHIPTQLAGIYNFENVMAALCVANQFRVDLDIAVEAISHYKPGMNRSQVYQSEKNLLILDAYNANPSSMRVAIDNFKKLNAGNKVLILGDMFELGEDSASEHIEVLKILDQQDNLKIYTAGPYFFQAAEAFDNIESYRSTEELKKALTENTPSNATILVKGSRGMKLETVVEIL